MLFGIAQVLLIVLLPALVLWGAKHLRLIRILSPVLTCYLAGILMANQDFVPVNMPVSMVIRNATVALAIPLLLFSVDIVGWLRLSRSTVLSFSLCVFSVMLMSAAAHFIFHAEFPDSASISGMMVGVYTGGTPNMNAIGTALKIKPEMFIALESVDMLMGAAYLVFLFTLGPRLFSLILPPFKRPEGAPAEDAQEMDTTVIPKDVLKGLGLTVLIVALSGGLSFLLPEMVQEAGAILLITTFSIVASLNPRIRAWRGTHEAGMYVLLIFCVAVGSCALLDNLLATPPLLVGYVALVMIGAAFLHVFLAALLRIDRDTVIITSTAAVYGPAFVGPVAQVLKNREMLVSGIASGLVGYAIGNYLGLALAWALGA